MYIEKPRSPPCSLCRICDFLRYAYFRQNHDQALDLQNVYYSHSMSLRHGLSARLNPQVLNGQQTPSGSWTSQVDALPIQCGRLQTTTTRQSPQMAIKREEDNSAGSKDEVKSTVHDVDESYFVDSPSTKKKLPDWLDHFNAQHLKILFKWSAAVWKNTLLNFINPTLKAIGQATSFAWYVVLHHVPSYYPLATA
jgi:hypothetical protein